MKKNIQMSEIIQLLIGLLIWIVDRFQIFFLTFYAVNHWQGCHLIQVLTKYSMNQSQIINITAEYLT